MATNSKIQWTDSTWNCVTGCTKVSDGCKNCYAAIMTKRLQAMGQSKYADGFEKIACHVNCLNDPLDWPDPRRVFVNSMADSFHKDVPDSFIAQMLGVMKAAPRHVFQVLTKRAERLCSFGEFPENVWLGVTVESPESMWRIDHLRQAKAKVKFLSLEPLLADLPELDLAGIDWVIVGGESGAKTKVRRMEADWVRRIRDRCLDAKVPFFFKQWGTAYGKKDKGGRELDGRMWDEMPEIGPEPIEAER